MPILRKEDKTIKTLQTNRIKIRTMYQKSKRCRTSKNTASRYVKKIAIKCKCQENMIF